MLPTRNYHRIVNWLYFDIKQKLKNEFSQKKGKKEKVSISHLGFIMLWELHYLLSSNISFNP